MKKCLVLLIAVLFHFASLFSQTANPNDPNSYQYVFIDAGESHSVALHCNGTVSCWGDNAFGQLGNNNNPTDSDVPVDVRVSPTERLTGIIAVAAGGNHTLALRYDGTVWAWGNNSNGQLGDNSTTQRNMAVQVRAVGAGFLNNAVAIEAGGSHSMAILDDGRVVAWGLNSSGQLADGSTTQRIRPVYMTGIDAGETAYAIAAGESHSYVLQSNGRVKSCGSDSAGELGDNGNSGAGATTSFQYVNTNSAGTIPLENIIAIASGPIHGLALDNSGSLWSWGLQSAGSNDYALGRTVSVPAYKYAGQVDVVTNAVAISCGENTSFALLNDGSMMVFGDDDQGQLGLGAGDQSTIVPTALPAFSNILAIAGGGTHTLLFLDDNTIYSFGNNNQGQLGLAYTGGTEESPVLVTNYDLGIIKADAGPDQFYCVGDSAQIGNEVPDYSTYTYSWQPAFGLIGGGVSTSRPDTLAQPYSKLSYAASIDYVLTKNIRGGSPYAFCVEPDTVTVVSSDEANAHFVSTAPSCTGDAVDFMCSGIQGPFTTYEWDFGSGANVPSGMDTVINPTGITYNTAGLKLVRLTVTDSCGGTRTTDIYSDGILIRQTPSVSFTSNTPICSQETANFTNTGSTGSAWTYSWDFGLGALPSTSTAENPSGITYTNHGTKTVSLTISNGYCFDTYTDNITVIESPTANFTSTAPECTGLDVDFTNTGSTGGTWTYAWNFGSGATPATSAAENPSGIVYNTAGTKVIELIVTNGSCADTIVQTITIHQTPDVGFSFTNNVCGGTNVDFTNTGSTGSSWTYSWDFGSGALPATSNNENPVGINYSTHGTKTITQTISSGYCANTTTQVLTILEKPIANFASTAPECTGLDVDFTNTGSTGGTWTYAWNFGSGATPATSTAENPSGVVYNTAGTKLIELIVTDGSCADTIIQTITIHQTPDVSFTSNAPQCANTGVNFTNTGSTGTNWTYSWDFGQGALPVSSSNENPVGILYTSAGNKNIVFTIADQYCNNTVIQSINIHEIPIADAGEDTTICANRSVQIGSNPISGFSYSWFPASTLDDPNIANPIASPVANQTQYILTVTNDSTLCQNFDTILVTMLNPIIANAGIDVEICAYDSVQIGAGFIEGQIYSWIPQHGLSNPFASNPIASPDSTTKYTLVVTDTAGCDAISDDVVVLVHPLPDAYAGEDDTIMGGTSTQLIGSGGVQYAWMPPYSLDNPNLFNPIASPDTSTTYILTVTDLFGCINTDTVNIIVYDFKEPFWLPTAFSPNNDGLNDILYVRGGNYESFEFSIFNRYGERIFKSTTVENGWDGRNRETGELMPSGAYVYKVHVKLENGETHTANGIVNLIR
jgi:gliding motility-associated-like protein